MTNGNAELNLYTRMQQEARLNNHVITGMALLGLALMQALRREQLPNISIPHDELVHGQISVLLSIGFDEALYWSSVNATQHLPFELTFPLPPPRKAKRIIERDELGRIMQSQTI